MPEQNTTAYYLTQTAEGLARKFDVKVLCGQPSYLSRGIKAPAHEILNGVEVRRCVGTTLDKNVLPLRLTNILTLGATTFFTALKNIRRGDEVIVVTAPPTLPFLINVVCRLKKARLHLLLHDSYPEVLTAVGKLKSDSKAVKIMNRLNQWLYRTAFSIITVGRDMEAVVKEKTRKFGTQVRTIQNWASLEEVSPQPRAENLLLRELGLEDKFVFLYAGNMGPPQDVESIVSAAKILQKQGLDKAHFLFIGAGGKKKWLENEVQNSGLQNVTVLAPRGRDEQTVFLNACDVALVPLIKGMKAVAMPSRTYNFMAAGKPILAIVESGSELEMVVVEDNLGWVVEPHNEENLARKIEEIVERRDKLKEIGERARKTALEKYSFEYALSRYEDLLNSK